MSQRWSKEENKIFEDLLVDGVAISDIREKIDRTEGAISTRAHGYGFRTVSTGNVKTLHKGIKERNRVSKDQSETKTDLATKPALSLTETSIESERVLEVNNQVVSMLQENGFELTPDIIYTLSNHKMNTKGS